MDTSKAIDSSQNYFFINHTLKFFINLEKEIQSLLETCECSFSLPNDYKLMAAEHAVENLVSDSLTADIDLYSAIERQDWQKANTIYQQVFRPALEHFAKKTILNLINKQAA